jgi:5-methylcytosine-specific restriction endonuclease McrA
MGDLYHLAAYQRARLVVLVRANERCEMTAGCPNRATTVDHIVPLAYGGTNDPANLRAACHACNSRGGAVIATERRRLRSIGRRSRTW